jgi:hypothetical protein
VVTLPANTAVLITAGSIAANTYFESIVVPSGSELVFADAAIALQLRTLKVMGALSIGSPTCRVSSNITLTFVGTKATSTGNGDKGIVGAAGTIYLII